MKIDSGLLKGHVALVGANVIWGLYAPLCKDLLNSQVIPPLTLAGLKTAMAALCFWMLYAVVRIVKPDAGIAKEQIDKADWVKLCFASLMIIAANQLCITIGLRYASPIDGTVLCGITPFITLLLGLVFFKTKVGVAKGIGAALGFVGMLMFIFGSEVNTEVHVSNPVLGDALFIMSQVCGAIYLVFSGDILSKYSSFTLMKWMFSYSAVIMIPLYGVEFCSVEWGSMTMPMWIELSYVILFATFLAFLLLPIGQKNVSPTTVAMYNYLQPVVTTVYAVAFGLAVLTGQTIIATALIFAGIWLVNKK